MGVSSDTCRGGIAPETGMEDARVQGSSKCFVSLCREMIESSLKAGDDLEFLPPGKIGGV